MPAIFVKSAIRAADIPESSKPQIAMVGRSNVGKSSLINHLAGEKLARSSSMPGLTQTINLYEFDGRYLLIDLPGYGFARKHRSVEGKGFADLLGNYLAESDRLRLVLHIIDARTGMTASDRRVFEHLRRVKLPSAVIVNKIDKLSHSGAITLLRELQAEFPKESFIPHSTLDNKTLGKIREAIESAVRGG